MDIAESSIAKSSSVLWQGQDTAALAYHAGRVAQAAGDVAMKWKGDFAVSTKYHAMDLVTEADKEAETVATGLLQAVYPTDSIRGEEGAAEQGNTGRCWWLDPIDGTINYVRGLPIWGASVGVESIHGPLAGAVYAPDLNQLWTGGMGVGLALNGEPIERPAGPDTLDKACMFSLWGWDPEDFAGDWLGRLASTLRYSVGNIQSYYATAPMLGMVAAGTADIYFADTTIGLKPWDLMGGLALCRSVGMTSRQLNLFSDRRQIIIGPPHLVAELEALLLKKFA